MRIKMATYTKKPVDIENLLAEYIQEGLSQTEMAQRIGISRPTMSRWLHDCGWVPVTTWVRREDAV